ncbi:hypothetical protein [Nocardioides sp. GY 10127]|uniref:hypothetical protein n=1 Tax=Nocardioides sp. GY 10127 TaxID=2569762 RepID=UPI0010A8BADF|nr:hypothetical protein [Nocardioides sp. GY 10127]TIC81666.1 hypothetical protein E8D37_10720 [Nocardioides sp. GY 10127]
MISGVTTDSRKTLLVGRNRELARIEAAAREGRPVLVRGRAGGGVTSVLREVSRRLGVAGRSPATGAGSPWVPEEAPEQVLADAGGLLPPSIRRGNNLVVDDADRCTPEELQRLADVARLSGVSLVLGAHEDVPLVSEDPAATVLDLPGLGRDAVAHMASAALGEALEPGGGPVSCLHRASVGNPGRLAALLDLPEIEPLVHLAKEVPDPATLAPAFAAVLESAVMARVDRLSPDGRTALAVVLVAGPHAPLALVISAVGRDGLDEAIACGLLHVEPGQVPELKHGAVGRLLAHRLPWQLRAEAERRLGVAAERAGVALAPGPSTLPA